MSREALVAKTFVELADNLVDEFDVVDLLSLLTKRCVEILSVDAAGLMLAASESDLEVVAASDENAHLLELFELQNNEGPCLECFQTGKAIFDEDIHQSLHRWPVFAPHAIAAGFNSVAAIPMRLRGSVIGALNLFSINKRALSSDEGTTAQALADVATITVLQYRAGKAADLLNEQLQEALHSRVLLEQAKGVIAEQAAISIDAAFRWLRSYARDNNIGLSEVARRVTERELDASEVPNKRASE